VRGAHRVLHLHRLQHDEHRPRTHGVGELRVDPDDRRGSGVPSATASCAPTSLANPVNTPMCPTIHNRSLSV
jgi:hypothetical protein